MILTKNYYCSLKERQKCIARVVEITEFFDNAFKFKDSSKGAINAEGVVDLRIHDKDKHL